MFNFRPLAEDEARILVGRHAQHKENVLTPEGKALVDAIGKALKASGIDISAAYSSPSPRALETIILELQAYGKMVYVRTEDDLADFAIEGKEVNDRLPRAMEERGLTGEPGYQALLFEPGNEFEHLMFRRATLGAMVIEKIARHHLKQTVSVTSHGIARIEPAIQVVKGQGDVPPPRFLGNGQIVELIINSKGVLVEENWLEPVTVPAA